MLNSKKSALVARRDRFLKGLLLVAAAACLGLSPADSNAQRGGGPGGGGPGGAGPGRGRGSSECVQTCRQNAASCQDPALEGVRTCLESNCADERNAAQAACEGAPRSESCKAAHEALRTCGAACVEPVKAQLEQCRADVQSCASGCPAVGGPRPGSGKDEACVEGCRAELNSCRTATGAPDCREQCGDEATAARAACEADRASAACSEARSAARSCMRSCRQERHTALKPCGQAARECVAACPEA
jgi:hypothetical protein